MSWQCIDSMSLPRVRFEPTPVSVTGQETHALTNNLYLGVDVESDRLNFKL